MATLILPTPTLAEFGRIYRLDLDGTFYRFRFIWNPRSNLWGMDLGSNDDVDIVRALSMVVSADILEPFRALAVPQGTLSVVDTSGAGLDPVARTDFGDRVQLQYEEVAT